MEPQTEPIADPFDAAVSAESTYVEPTTPPADTSVESFTDEEADVNDAKPTRDTRGRFAPVSASELDEIPVPGKKTAADIAETRRDVGQDKHDATLEQKAEAQSKKPRNDPEARIAQAIGRQREAERRAEEAERRARDVEGRASQVRGEPGAPPKADKFPTYAGFLDTHPDASLEDYMDARDDDRDQRREAKTREQQETSHLEQTFKTRATRFSDEYEKATEADPELPKRIDTQLLSVRPYSNLTAADKALIRQIPNPQERDAVAFRCFLADQWIESEHAVALLEHLSDPTVYQRLATLPPNQVIRELAKYEAGLTAAPRKDDSGSVVEAKPASKARPPFKPLGTTSHVAADDESDDDPIEKHIARYNAADRKAGRL